MGPSRRKREQSPYLKVAFYDARNRLIYEMLIFQEIQALYNCPLPNACLSGLEENLMRKYALGVLGQLRNNALDVILKILHSISLAHHL